MHRNAVGGTLGQSAAATSCASADSAASFSGGHLSSELIGDRKKASPRLSGCLKHRWHGGAVLLLHAWQMFGTAINNACMLRFLETSVG